MDQNPTAGNRLINPAAGLVYLPNLLSPEQQRVAVKNVDASVDQWRHDRSRRTQRYGWRYDYRAKASCQGYQAQAITPDLRLGQLPDWLQTIAQPIFENAVHPDTGQPRFERVPEQCMVWEQSATNESKSKAAPWFSPTAKTITSAATFRTTRN